MQQDAQKLKNSLHAALFWDVDIGRLNLKTDAQFVITRVMEHGTREEVRAIWHYYGAETIRGHLLAARFLSPKTISYFANIFNISRIHFRSYRGQGPVETWP